MSTIQFETGQKVEFDGDPTPEDIEEVANTLKLQKTTTKIPKPDVAVLPTDEPAPLNSRSFLDDLKSGIKTVVNTGKKVASNFGAIEENLFETVATKKGLSDLWDIAKGVGVPQLKTVASNASELYFSGTKKLFNGLASNDILSGEADKLSGTKDLFSTLSTLSGKGEKVSREQAKKANEEVAKFYTDNTTFNDPNDTRPFLDKIISEDGEKEMAKILGAQLPTFGALLGVGVLTGGTGDLALGATMGTSFALNAGDAYQQGKDYVASTGQEMTPELENKIQKASVLTGALTAPFDAFGMGKILSRTKFLEFKNKLISNVVNSVLDVGVDIGVEGTTETIQQGIQNAFAKTYNEFQDIWEGLGESFFGGAVFGGGSSAVFNTPSLLKTGALEVLKKGSTPEETKTKIKEGAKVAGVTISDAQVEEAVKDAEAVYSNLASDIASKIEDGQSVDEIALQMATDAPLEETTALVTQVAENLPEKIVNTEINTLSEKVGEDVLQKNAKDLQDDFERTQAHIDEQMKELTVKEEEIKSKVDEAPKNSTEKKRLKAELENTRRELRQKEETFYTQVANNAQAFRSFVEEYAVTAGAKKSQAKEIASIIANMVTDSENITNTATIQELIDNELSKVLLKASKPEDKKTLTGKGKTVASKRTAVNKEDKSNFTDSIESYIKYYKESHAYPSVRGLESFIASNPTDFTKQDLLKEYRKSPTQKDKVKEVVEKKGKATIREIAKETGILEPNVRRILGMGAKEGEFKRVDSGVYTITTKDGTEVAVVIPADAVETLPKLAKEGFKSDMVFLDIPYDTPAVKGGNRGVKYNLLSVNDFAKILDAVSDIVKEKTSPVIHMFSQAESGMEKMQKYNDLFIEKGFIPVGRGEYQKTFADGSPVTSPNGKVSKPEGIIVFTKSGELKKDLGNLNFKLVRPKGYQTEKHADMLKAMIEMTTEEGDVVLDPFAGSGVTGAEAVKARRKAVLIEKNEDVARNITTPRVKEAIKEISPKEKQAKENLIEEVTFILETSEAGRRIMIPEQNSSDYNVKGVKSTFPVFVPENMRSRKMFDRLLPFWKAQERPTKKTPALQKLYDIFQGYVEKELPNRAKKIEEDKVRTSAVDTIPFKLKKYDFDTNYSKKNAVAYLDDLKKRLNIDFDVNFVDSILADYRVDPLKRSKIARFAEGTYIDNTIAIVNEMAQYTAEHETVHLTLDNMYRIDAFTSKGLTKEKVLTAMANKQGVVLTEKNALEIEEQVAYDFEKYINGKSQPKGILLEFCETLKKLLTKFAQAVGLTEGDIIKDYYDILSEGESVTDEMKRFENKGIIQSFIEDGQLNVYALETSNKDKIMSDKQTEEIVSKIANSPKEDRLAVLSELTDEELSSFANNPKSNELFNILGEETETFWDKALTQTPKFKLREEGDAYTQKLKKNFNELTIKTERLANDTKMWREDIEKSIAEKATLAEDVSSVSTDVKEASRFTTRTKKPVGELTEKGKELVSTLEFKNPAEAQKEISAYLQRKAELVQTIKQLRKLSKDISNAKKEGKETRAELRDIARRLKLRKRFLEQKDYYVNMGMGRGKKEAFSMVQKRTKAIREAQDFFNISDAKAKEIIGSKSLQLMSEKSFNEFLTYFTNRAQLEDAMVSAREEVESVIFEKQFKKEDNLRKALGLPPLDKMTEAQATMYAGALYQYEFGDVFLTKREIETSARTKFDEVKTERELLAKIEEVAGIPATELKNVEAKSADRYKNWLQLSKKNLFYKWLVERKMLAKTKELQQVYAFRQQLDSLTRKARASRTKTFKENIWDFVAPTDNEVFTALNTGDFSKLTIEEKALADFLTIMFRAKYDKLKENFKDFKGRENYVTHMSRDFFETLRDTGSLKEAYNSFRDEQKDTENALEILAGQTGEILAFDKFLPYMLKRSDKIVPSKNVSRIALTYFTATTRKELLDEFIPEAMLTLHGFKILTGQTQKGLDMKPFLETFTKEYLNDAKGRKIDFITRQGSDYDNAVMAFTAWISFKYIGGNPILAFMNLFGDLVALSAGTSNKQKAIAISRIFRKNNAEEVIRGIIGHNPINDFLSTQTGMFHKIIPAWFSLMSSTSYLANKFTAKGLLTAEEFKNGIVTDERIIEIAKQVNKFKLMDSYGRSLVGNTTTGKASLQFKTWAIPFLITALEDIKSLGTIYKEKGFNPQTKKDAIELARIAVIGALMYAIVQAISGGDEDKDSYLWKQIENNLNTIYGILTMPFDKANLVPVMVGEIQKIQDLIKQTATLEKYAKPNSTGKYAGDLKALETLKQIVIPAGATRIFKLNKSTDSPRETLINEAIKSGKFDPEGIASKTSENWSSKTMEQQEVILNEIKLAHTVLTKYPDNKIVSIVLAEKNNADRVSKLIKYSEKNGLDNTYEELKDLMKDKDLYANQEKRTAPFISANLFRDFQLAKKKLQTNQ